MKTGFTYYVLFVLFLSACSKDSEKPGPIISDFTPQKGSFNNIIAIQGKNFDSSIANTSVTFNGILGTVEFVSDTLIRVRVPENATTGKIAVKVNGNTVISNENFIILPGKWILKKSLVAAGYDTRHALISFATGNKAYAGLGFNGGSAINDLWEYDPVTNNWTRKANCGVDTDGGVTMLINGKAYLGFGRSDNLACCGYHRQIWEYNPGMDTWTRKADFPGQGRWGPFGIGLNGKGYMGMGSVNNGVIIYDWWEYDPATDTWTQKASVPSTGYHFFSTGFAINNKIYVGTTAYGFGNDWFEYDPATNTWTRKADFPGTVYFAASGFVIGNKGYVAGGGSECWEYDPSTNSWTEKAFFDHRMGGTAFALNNKGYYMGGSFSNNDQWEFTP